MRRCAQSEFRQRPRASLVGTHRDRIGYVFMAGRTTAAWHPLCESPRCPEGAERLAVAERGASMARLFVCDTQALVTADIETSGPVLNTALDHEQAEPVISCAVLMAVSALAQGGPWPSAVLQAMAAFMALMKDEVGGEQLM